MNANIKDGILYNGNPDTNSAAKPLFSLGAKKVGDTVYSFSYPYIVTDVNVVIKQGRSKFPGLKAVNVSNGREVILLNAQKDCSGIWE